MADTITQWILAAFGIAALVLLVARVLLDELRRTVAAARRFIRELRDPSARARDAQNRQGDRADSPPAAAAEDRALGGAGELDESRAGGEANR